MPFQGFCHEMLSGCYEMLYMGTIPLPASARSRNTLSACRLPRRTEARPSPSRTHGTRSGRGESRRERPVVRPGKFQCRPAASSSPRTMTLPGVGGSNPPIILSRGGLPLPEDAFDIPDMTCELKTHDFME